MGWLGRYDRRHRPRRPYDPEHKQEPTYLVERDAPSGFPLDPNVRWFQRAVKRFRGSTYDAYPDHEIPWHVVGPEGPAVPVRPVSSRLPKPRKGISLFVKRHGKMREVKLAGLPFEVAANVLNRRIVAGWVASEITKTIEQMEEDEMNEQESRRLDDEGQGLAEYALILALIAIVAIVGLIVLGGAIGDILQSVGESVGAQPGTP